LQRSFGQSYAAARAASKQALTALPAVEAQVWLTHGICYPPR